MKIGRIVFLSVCCTFLCLGVVEVAAQRKFIDSQTFSSAWLDAFRKGFAKDRKIETVTEELDNGAVISRSTHTAFIIGETSHRIVDTIQTRSGVTKTETIRIGNFIYHKENNGAWSKQQLDHSPSNYSGPVNSIGELTLSQYTTESVLYLTIMTYVFEDYSVKKGNSGLEYREKKYWVDLNGSLLREEIFDGTLSPREVKRRQYIDYRYDIDHKIEAPIN